MADTTRIIRPCPVGWVEYDLSPVEIDYLWERVNERGGDHKPYLIGHVSESNTLVDKDNWFFDNVLGSVVSTYIEQYPSIVKHHQQFENVHPLVLDKLCVNYQKQNEFNPT